MQHNPNSKTYVENSNYGKAMRVLSENEEKLLQLLEGKEKKFFIEYSDLTIIRLINNSTSFHV